MSKANKVYNYNKDTDNKRVQTMVEEMTAMMANVNEMHVRVMSGNKKTGKTCHTVSLLPVLDCGNCNVCKNDCYDLHHDMWRVKTRKAREVNSAIHKTDVKRYFNEIADEIVKKGITELRYNVGGDFTETDFTLANELAGKFPGTDFLVFTKNYDDANRAIAKTAEGKFNSNLHVIFSAWRDVEMNNPYNLPTSHVLYPDGSTTAPEFGAYFCGGNCSVCHFHKVQGNKAESGCWGLVNGEAVVFNYH